LIEYPKFDEVGSAAWDAVVSASPDGWMFATAGWRDAILSVAPWGFRDLSFAIKEGSAILAVMPLQVQPAAKRAASSGWGLAGPIIARGIVGKRRAKLIADILRRSETLAAAAGAEYLEVGVSPLTETALTAPWGVNPFVEAGYEDVSTVVRMIDLTRSVEKLWSDLSSNARQMIRKAEAAGYTAVRESWPEYVARYYETHVATYTRTGATPHPKSYFDGIAHHVAAAGHAVLWVGRSPAGDPVAFHNDARFNAGSLYHTGCSRSEHLESGINYLLMWNAILGAKSNGCRWYDVGEVFPWAKEGKDRGLTVFKSKFGGEFHRYFKARKQLQEPANEASDLALPAGESGRSSVSPWQAWWRAAKAMFNPATRSEI
jgi:hypothetical protein